MINNVNLMGRIIADPELKTTNNNKSVTSFRIAVDRNYKDADGNTQADFINIVAWGNTAEFICRYFGKGALIAIQGHIQTRQYQDKETGKNRTAFEIIADQVSFTGEKRNNNNNTTPQPQNNNQQSGYQQQNNQQYNQGQQQGGYNNAPQQNYNYPQQAPQQNNGGYQQNNQPNGGYNAPAQQSAPPQQYNQQGLPNYEEVLDDDDLPF